MRCILLRAFRVVTDSFSFLYVSEFFNCGLRSFALARATKGLCPLESRSLEKAGELFSFWCGFGDAVPLNLKSKMNRTKSVHFTIKTLKSPLRGHITISLNNSKATASRAVSRKNSADAAPRKTRGGVPTIFWGVMLLLFRFLARGRSLGQYCRSCCSLYASL